MCSAYKSAGTVESVPALSGEEESHQTGECQAERDAMGDRNVAIAATRALISARTSAVMD